MMKCAIWSEVVKVSHSQKLMEKCKSCKEVGEEVMRFHSRRQFNCSSTWDFQITTSAAKSQYYCKVFVHLCYFWFRFQICFFTRPSAILWPQPHHRQMRARKGNWKHLNKIYQQCWTQFNPHNRETCMSQKNFMQFQAKFLTKVSITNLTF